MNSFMAGPVSPLISLIASSSPAQHRTSTLAFGIATSHGMTTRLSGYYDYYTFPSGRQLGHVQNLAFQWKQNLRSKPFFLTKPAITCCFGSNFKKYCTLMILDDP